MLHDVAACVEWTGQTHATYRNTVAKRTQHVVPNNVTRCCVEMLRAFGQAFRLIPGNNLVWLIFLLKFDRFLSHCGDAEAI